jgi:hypothetical protein
MDTLGLGTVNFKTDPNHDFPQCLQNHDFLLLSGSGCLHNLRSSLAQSLIANTSSLMYSKIALSVLVSDFATLEMQHTWH